MDRRIDIIRALVSQNAFGEEIPTWETLVTVWAEMKPMTGSERYVENQFQGVTNSTFRIRWSDAVKTMTVEDKIIFDNRLFDVLGVREISRREGLEIDAFSRGELQVADGDAPLTLSNAIVWNGVRLTWGW